MYGATPGRVVCCRHTGFAQRNGLRSRLYGFATGDVREPLSLEPPSVVVEAGELELVALDGVLFKGSGRRLVRGNIGLFL